MHKTFGDSFKVPLNTSNNNHAFAFTRGSRFAPDIQPSSQAPFYNQELPRQARTATFGIGQRSSLVKSDRAPSPGAYDPQSPTKLHKGFSFSMNKKICFVDEQAKMLSKNPAPTKYEKTLFGKSCSFSFRSKYQDPLEVHRNKLGPGQYNINGLINQKGAYFQSKHNGSRCGIIGRQKRFGSDQTPVPGPGKYKDSLGIDPVGNYFNSRIQSKGIRTFGKPVPVSLFAINPNPGPGTYYHFPQFPTYLSK